MRLGRAATAILAFFLSVPVFADEVIVKNDSLVDGGLAAICICFEEGEEAAAWLTSPCNGSIVGVQVFWKSQNGGAKPSLEDSITLYHAGAFPAPGAVMTTLDGGSAELIGPAMQDGGLNEFRYLDPDNTVPLIVPVSQGQTFVVSLRFANANLGNPEAASVVSDTDGCQPSKNAVYAIPGGWTDFCSYKPQGDWVIRAVVECGTSGACCLPGGTCTGPISQADCLNEGGNYRGDGSVCNSSTCKGACCVESTQSCVDFTQPNCAGAGGVFQGFNTSCSTFNCFPTGACCLSDGSCLNDIDPFDCQGMDGIYQGHDSFCSVVKCPIPEGACCANDNCLTSVTEQDCLAVGGEWAGPLTDCADANGNKQPDVCEVPCPADLTTDGVVNVNDLLNLIGSWGMVSADLNGDGTTNVNDLLILIGAWGPCP